MFNMDVESTDRPQEFLPEENSLIDVKSILERLLRINKLETYEELSRHFGYYDNWATQCDNANHQFYRAVLVTAIDNKMSVKDILFDNDGKLSQLLGENGAS